MNKFLISSIFVSLFTLSITSFSSESKKETVKVCVDIKDKDGKPVKNKDGSTRQNCKEMKVHQKLEGTKMPEKK